MINLQKFPDCCTAWTISQFGNSGQQGNDTRQYTVQELIDNISQSMLDVPATHAIIVAITNSTQINVHEALKKIGFERVEKDFTKIQHSNTTLQLWYYHMNR